MNIGYANRIVHPEVCFVCRWAGTGIVFWPQEPGLRPSSEAQGTWNGYLNSHGQTGREVPRSGHRSLVVCATHWFMLEEDWIKVAQDEIELATAWDRYIERISS